MTKPGPRKTRPKSEPSLPKWRTGPDPESHGPSAWSLSFERYAHILSAVLIVAGPIILLTLIAAGIVYVRLSHGPVSLKAFSSSIEKGINSELVGFTASIDDAVLALAEGRGLEIQLVNVRISEPDG